MSRISELPRRDWRLRAAPFVEPLSALLRAPGGTRTLRLGQTAALLEAVQGGVVKQGRVGTGKTTTLSLLPTVLRKVRPLYLTAGGLLGDTRKEIDNEVRPHWRIPADLELMSYTALSNFPRKGLTLRSIWPEGPDIILADEVQNLAGVRTAACAKQIHEWTEQNPECIFCGTTGSLDLEGLPSYAHIFDWGLRDRSPLPLTPHEIFVWHEVIDEGEPGKIWQVAADLGVTRTSSIDQIRSSYRDRIHSAPGVIVDDTPFTAVPLTVQEHLFDVGLEAEFERLRTLGQRPDGWDVLPSSVLQDSEESDEPDRAANGSIGETSKQFASGFFYKCWPPPPPEWLKLRRNYFRHVRAQTESGLFMTEAQVRADAIANNIKAWTEWAAAQPTFTPQFHTVWLSEALVDTVNDWAKQGPGVVWVEHIAVGLHLEEKLGLTYYGGRGRARNGKYLPISKKLPPSKEVIIASRKANGVGRNMQFQWDRCLFTQPIGRAYLFEQAVGRFHREGVETWSKGVHADILMRCSEDWRARKKLLHKAQATHESIYSQKAGSVPWKQVSRPSDGWAFQ